MASAYISHLCPFLGASLNTHRGGGGLAQSAVGEQLEGERARTQGQARALQFCGPARLPVSLLQSD